MESMRVAVGVALAILIPGAAAAHGVDAPLTSDPRVFSLWDQAVLAGLTIMGTLYWIGARELRARRAGMSRIERAAFGVGWLALVVSILPWFDAAALDLFSAHMAQHELMMLVGAPLIVAGRPMATCLWALPERWRRRVVLPLQRPRVAGMVRVMAAPITAWTLHGLVVWIWHAPGLYELAVRSEPVHTLQHAMFVSTSVLFWWGLIYGRYGRAGYGAAVFYVFTTAIHTGILGALLTFAPSPLYGVYATPGHHDPLGDQQLAGLVMWIPAGLLLTMMGVGLFAAWLGESERRATT
jgi:putative membrane protein